MEEKSWPEGLTCWAETEETGPEADSDVVPTNSEKPASSLPPRYLGGWGQVSKLKAG